MFLNGIKYCGALHLLHLIIVTISTNILRLCRFIFETKLWITIFR